MPETVPGNKIKIRNNSVILSVIRLCLKFRRIQDESTSFNSHFDIIFVSVKIGEIHVKMLNK